MQFMMKQPKNGFPTTIIIRAEGVSRTVVGPAAAEAIRTVTVDMAAVEVIRTATEDMTAAEAVHTADIEEWNLFDVIKINKTFER